MAFRFIVSKPGFDAGAEEDTINFTLDSNFNHLKTVKYGSFTQTGSGTKSILHGLTYKPLCLAYFRDTATPGRWYLTMSGAPSTSPFRHSASDNVSLYVDDSYAYFKISTSPGTEIEVNYEIFYEGDE